MPRKRYDEFRLRPRGRDIDEDHEVLDEAEAYELMNDIDTYRMMALTALKARPSRKEQRTDAVENGRIHKFAYLYGLEPKRIGEKEIVYLLADRYTIFNKKYQIFNINRGLFIAGRKRTGTTREKQFEYCMDIALNSSCQDDGVRKKISVWLRALEALAAGAKMSLPEKYDELLSEMDGDIRDNEEQICAMLRNELGIETDKALSESESRLFCLRVLPEYRSAYRQVLILIRESKNYMPSFRKGELARSYEDMRCTARLRQIADEYAKWRKTRLEFPSIDEEISSSNKEKGDEYSGKYIYLTEEQIQRITSLSGTYINAHNKDAGEIDEHGVRRLLDSICEALLLSDSKHLFPFVYLMACTADIRILSRGLTVNDNKLRKALGDPYTQRPSRKEQRIIAIHFLRELISICCAKKEKEIENWRLFLQSYGAEILSREETELWKDIIEKTRRDENPCTLPPVELVLLGSEFLKECCPLDYSGLYSYESGSVIHTGGFMAYIKENPDTVKKCALRMTGGTWEKNRKNYAEKVNRINCDIQDIKAMCRKCSEMIYWNRLPGASDTELHGFCGRLYVGWVEDTKIERNIAELRALIVEAAMQYSLSESGKRLLKEAFCIAFNAHSVKRSDDNVNFNVNLTEY